MESGATVEYSIDGGSNWSTSAPTLAQLVQGSNTVEVRQTDLAGNVSSAGSLTFTLDTSTAAPGVALTTDSGSSASDHITDVGTLALSGLEAGATVSYSIDGGTTFTSSFSAVEGLNNVIVRATDVAGNTNDTAFSFTLDTSTAAPTVALTTDSGSSSSDHITNVGTLNVSGLESGATVTYSTDGGSTFTSSFTAAQGINNVIVRATDVAGNTNDTAFSFTLDTSTAAPAVALTTDSGSSASDHITNVGTLNVSGLESGATVTYSTDGGSTFTGSFSAAQGINNVIVRATDVAGNTSDTAFSFTLDTAPAAPTVALTNDTGSSGSDQVTNDPSLTLTGIESGATVEYSLDGGSNWSTSAPTLAQLVQGANTVEVRQTDLAGNVSTPASSASPSILWRRREGHRH